MLESAGQVGVESAGVERTCGGLVGVAEVGERGGAGLAEEEGGGGLELGAGGH